MADIQLPDGSFIRLPNYALESTQEKMLLAMETQLGKNTKALKRYRELVENAKETAKSTKQHQKFQVRNSKGLLGKLKELVEVTEDSNRWQRLAVAAGRDLASSFKSIGKLGFAAATVAGALTRLAKESVMGFGSMLTELTQQGVGLTDVRGSAMELIADLQRLGFTSTEAANTMATFGKVVQTAGKREFANLQQEFARITNFGTRFGMTMAEASEILNEDLEIRQRLGILQSLDHHRQAQMSRDLFEMQMQSAAVLGRSIDEIRKLSMNVMEDPIAAIRAHQIAMHFSEKETNNFIQGMRTLTTQLGGYNIPDQLTELLISQAQAMVPFQGPEAEALGEALAAAGTAGLRVRDAILRHQQLMDLAARGDRVAYAQLAGARDNIAHVMLGLTDISEENIQLLGIMGMRGNQIAYQLNQAALQAKQYRRNLDKAQDSFLDALAKSASTFKQAFAQVRGSIASGLTTVVASFGKPMDNLSKAFSTSVKDTSSVLETLQLASNAVGQALFKLLGGFLPMDDSVEDLRVRLNTLVESIRDSVIVYIERFGKYLEDIGGPNALFEKFTNGLSRLVSATTGVVKFFGMLGKLNWKTLLMVAIAVPIAKALAVGITAAFGKALVSKAMTTTLGKWLATKGLLGKTALAASSSMAPRGIPIPTGPNPGGFLTGMAAGLGKFAVGSVKILAGAAVFGAAVGIIVAAIGTGLAAATYIMGKALPSLAKGLESFNMVDGKNLLNVGKGMIAFGAGLAAMGAGAAAGAIGGALAYVFDYIMSLTNGRSLMERLKEFGSVSGINVSGVERNSRAAVAFGNAMSALSKGMRDSRRGALRNLVASIWEGLSEMRDIPTMMQRLKDFGNDFGINAEGVRRNAAAVEAFGDALAALSGAESFRSSIIRDGINVEYWPGLRASLISFRSILDVLDDDFVGNMRRFGATPLPAALEENSRKVTAFAQSMKEIARISRTDLGMFITMFGKSRDGELDTALDNLKGHLLTFSRLGTVNSQSVETQANMLNRMAGVYERFASINSDKLASTARSINTLNQALITARQIPAPDTSAAAAASVDTLDQAESQLRRLSETSSNDMRLLIEALIQSNQTTHRKLATINESIRNS